MQLTRDAIQRMCGAAGKIINGGGSGGFDPSTLAGFATEQWVDENYVSIAFFSRLFQAKNGNTNVNPNDTTSTINSIKAMFGFWTEQYISALGQNSAGGGGGGATALSDLVDVSLTNPTSGQVLKYDGTHWVNGSVTTGTVTSVGLSMPTGFTVSNTPVTSTGTLAVSFGGTVNANRVLASPNGSNGAPSWRALVAADIPDLSSTYATDARADTLEGYFDNGNAKSALKLTTVSKTAWGQTYWNANGVPVNISGDMSSVGNIQPASDGQKTLGDSTHKWASSYIQELHLGYSNGRTWMFASINQDTANESLIFKPEVSGKLFRFRTYSDSDALIFNGDTGNFGIGVTPDSSNPLRVESSLRIGDAVIVWDSTNNALKIQKNDGTAANLYALGGVSSLGINAGSGGTDSATITTLTTNRVNVGNTNQYITKGSISSTDILLIHSNTTLMLEATNGVAVNGNLTSYSGTWFIGTIDGDQNCARFSRLYLTRSGTSSVYLYASGTELKLVIGNTTYNISKTTA